MSMFKCLTHTTIKKNILLTSLLIIFNFILVLTIKNDILNIIKE